MKLAYIKNNFQAPYYGVEWSTAVSSPACTRVGSSLMHANLPIQNAMRAVLLNDDGTVNYALNPSDWSLKLTGGASDLTGADGEVMIEIPEHYFKYEVDGVTRRLLLAQIALTGYTYVKKTYISAYEAALSRSTLKLASIKNTTPDYRGGNNTSAWDAEDRTLLGRPATSISRTNFRTYARNRGANWQMYNYLVHNIMSYLFVIEFATRDSQKAVNAALDGNGYRQGGLGAGVTNLNGTNWNTWNSYNPFVPCGYSDSLGSGTGEVALALPAGYGATLTTYVNRYRGVEMPFGHIWKNADGINVRIGADSDADPTSKVYITNDATLWNDANYTGFTLMGQIPRTSGYITQMIPGHMMPLAVGGGSTTYWCDYFYTSLPGSGVSLRTVRFGGAADYSVTSGFGYSDTIHVPTATHATIGSRICYMPA